MQSFANFGFTQENLIDIIVLIGDRTITNFIHGATQIPVDFLFKSMLKIEDEYDPNLFNEHQFLHLFAFSTKFVALLRKGLQTYNTPRFRNFAKRLGQLIRHTVEFVSDHLRAFKVNSIRDKVMLARIQVEYDEFFLRAVKSIFSAQKLGAWHSHKVHQRKLIKEI